MAERKVHVEVLHETIVRVALPQPHFGIYAWSIRNQVGESPVWDCEANSLLWIDVRAPAVFRLDPSSGKLSRWTLPEVVGALGLVGANKVVLALQRHIAVLHLDGCELSYMAAVEDEPSHNRLNEGKVSPSGRWFVFGSMDDRAGEKAPSGALYRAEGDGTVTRLFAGLTIANGIAWTADSNWLYFSDSYLGTVWRAPWNENLGRMGKPMVFTTSADEAGRPDGALMDLSDNYLSAGVSAGCLNKFNPDGKLISRLALPAKAPTMPCLGGSNLTRLFVTSLVRPTWEKLGEFDGALFELDAPCNALPSVPWKVAKTAD